MELDLFDFDLPADRIAQQPLEDRTSAKLLRLDRGGGIEHRQIRDLPRILRPGDLLVINDTAVVPAKLSLQRETGGRIGGLFLREIEPGRWLVLLQSKGRLRVGESLTAVDDETVTLTIDRRAEAGQWEVTVSAIGGEPSADPAGAATAAAEMLETMTLLSRIGQTPLPPYIRRPTDRPDDRDRYQTVFASYPGAVAAPTAGLHFTDDLLAELADAGVQTARVTLHVGLGTFEPIRQSHIEQHRMHGEWFACSHETAEAVNVARAEHRRVVAVGTTSVRVLESCWDEHKGRLRSHSGWTDIFIYPGYRFHAVDALLTNFHLPRSSLLVLVAAFAGRERILETYRQAIAQGYRFYSYGDAMLIE